MNCEIQPCRDVLQEKITHDAPDNQGYQFQVAKRLRQQAPLLTLYLMMVIILNFPIGKIFLLPFQLFSTWAHEVCHCLAALFVGGRVAGLYIFQDGSGICYYYLHGETWESAFVGSAGYVGTAVIGAILLLFRRSNTGIVCGIVGLGFAMLLTCILYASNPFGQGVMITEGLFLVLTGCFRRTSKVSVHFDLMFSLMAASCSLNSLLDLNQLFRSSEGLVQGNLVKTDAQTVSEHWGFNHEFWALLWCLFAVSLTLLSSLLSVTPLERDEHVTQSKRCSAVADSDERTITISTLVPDSRHNHLLHDAEK